MIFMAFTCLAMIVMASCSTNNDAVKFTEVHNYFYRNDAPVGEHLLKLTSQEEFDRYFGAAAFMGKDGEPTKIDFSQEFVIAKVLSETNLGTEISNITLKKDNDGHLNLDYKTKNKESQSYTIRPIFQIAVSREFVNDELNGIDK